MIQKKPGLPLILAVMICVAPAAPAALAAEAAPAAPAATGLHVMPHFHPATMGWVAKYSVERNFCLNDYLAHLDRVAADPQYRFAYSEIPHLITMLEFEPQRFQELQQRIKEGRVEVVNAFVLEPTLNLSGGEALVMQGVVGLRWYDQVMNLRPRYLWMIDSAGWHKQMAQIMTGLGLKGMVYVRGNPVTHKYAGPQSLFHEGGLEPGGKDGQALHWIESPDGSRALGINPGHYKDKDLVNAFMATEPLTDNQLRQCIQQQQFNRDRYPPGAPLLAMGSSTDYSMPFYCKTYPSRLIADWNRLAPTNLPIRMSTLSQYMDTILPRIDSGQYQLETAKGGASGHDFGAFWVQVPEIKQGFRNSEHALQASEALATIANLQAGAKYAAKEFSDSWFLMCLQMDRNILWGVLIDESYKDPESWDVADRFEYVNSVSKNSNTNSLAKLTHHDPGSLALFNPVNRQRSTPFEVRLPHGLQPAGTNWQWLADGRSVLVAALIPPLGLTAVTLKTGLPAPERMRSLPAVIENKFFQAVINPDTGNLASLRLRSSGREIIQKSSEANVVVAQVRDPAPTNISAKFGIAHNVPSYAKRRTVAASGTPAKPAIYVQQGALATIVDVREPFYGGGELRRVIRFYNDSPRIDFETTTGGFPEGTIVSVEFPLAEEVVQIRRGIPYGFAQGPVEGRNLLAEDCSKGILPVIRWSDYEFHSGGGVALLDRGVPAREFVGQKAIILLNQAAGDKYYYRDSTIMADKGEHTYSYALIAHDEKWDQINIPAEAWEYNSDVVAYRGGSISESVSFLETSENVIVEALRRVADEIEIRLVECKGKSGVAQIQLKLPHESAAMTDMLGKKLSPLPGGPVYRFEVKPQQIVTLRFKTKDSVGNLVALKSFDSVIPPIKREYMKKFRNPAFTGHPGEFGKDWKPSKTSRYPGGVDRKEFEAKP